VAPILSSRSCGCDQSRHVTCWAHAGEVYHSLRGQVVYVALNGQGQVIGAYADEDDAKANTNYIVALRVR
jgi:hypothetical protein